MEIRPTTVADGLWPRPFSQLQENIFFDQITGDLFLVADDGGNGFLISHPTPAQRKDLGEHPIQQWKSNSEMMSERTKQGIARARENGSPIGRPKGIGKSKLDPYRKDIVEWLEKGFSRAAIAKLTDSSPTAVNHYVRTRGLVTL